MHYKTFFRDNIQYRHVVMIFAVFIVFETVLRYLWGNLTPLTFTFPALLYAMFLKIKPSEKSPVTFWLIITPLLPIIPFSLLLTIAPPSDISWWFIFYFVLFIVVVAYSSYTMMLAMKLSPKGADTLKQSIVLFIGTTQVFSAFLSAFQGINNFFSTNDKELMEFADLFPENLLRYIPLIFILVLLHYYLYQDKSAKKHKCISAATQKAIGDKLSKIFDEEKIYLNSTLSIKTLRDITGIDKYELDCYFEHSINKEFNLFLAEYRITHALELIKTHGKEITIEGLSMECGYGSRTSFNKYFKYYVGINPSEYLNMTNI